MDTEKTSGVANQEEMTVLLINTAADNVGVGYVSFPGKVDGGQVVSWMRRNGHYDCTAIGLFVRPDTPMFGCFDAVKEATERFVPIGETPPELVKAVIVMVLTNDVSLIGLGPVKSGAKGEIGLSRVN